MRDNTLGFSFGPVVTGEPVTSLFGTGLSLFGNVVNLFRGATEPESFQRDIEPVIGQYVSQNQIPVFVFWYGEFRGLTPQGAQIVISSPDMKDLPYNPDLLEAYVQEYANQTGRAAGIWTDADGAPPWTGWIDRIEPESSPVQSTPGTDLTGPMLAGLSGNSLAAVAGLGLLTYLMITQTKKGRKR